ncbi:MAG: GMC family oxidoreductase [Deltaproteobacteria bacterium]|nr:GMC family oxidoreductase [Deltaproteobacteria bacterium]
MSRVFTAADWPDVIGGERKQRLFGQQVTLKCDTVIVGSGAGGAATAAELAERGQDVIVLEEGGYHTRFEAQTSKMVQMLYRDGGVTLAAGRPPVIVSEGRCVGGSTTVNGGMSWRTPEEILARWQTEHGLGELLSPVTEQIFERVERLISARLNDEHTIGRDNALLRDGAKQRGWKVIPNIRNQVHCAGSNNCAFGCPTGAKQSTLVSYLPRAMHFGARVFADCRVDRVLFRGKRAVGVSGSVARHDRQIRFRVLADRVVVAAGASQTPALLARSGIKHHQLGRNLALHPNTKVIALFDEPVRGYEGAHQLYQVREFEREGILMAAVNIPPAVVAMTLRSYGPRLHRLMQRYNDMVCAGLLVEDSVCGRVWTVPGGRPLMSYQISDFDAQRLQRGTILLCQLLFDVGATRIVLPFDGVADLTSPDDLQRLKSQPIDKHHVELSSVHIMCTARMGGDPKRHVCDPHGAVYDRQQLYVCDASLFPTPIGVNPMETVMALATRNAAHIAATA